MYFNALFLMFWHHNANLITLPQHQLAVLNNNDNHLVGGEAVGHRDPIPPQELKNTHIWKFKIASAEVDLRVI